MQQPHQKAARCASILYYKPPIGEGTGAAEQIVLGPTVALVLGTETIKDKCSQEAHGLA